MRIGSFQIRWCFFWQSAHQFFPKWELAFPKPQRVSTEFFVITFQGIKTCEHRFSRVSSCLVLKVDQQVIERLSVQSRPDPMGGLCCFLCTNKTWTLSLDPFDTLTIVKNKLEMRKLQPPKQGGFKNSKEKPPNTTKASSQTFKKNLCMLLLEFKNDS
jgi:hypothetical protein